MDKKQETLEEAKKRTANYMSLKGALDTQYVDFSNPNADKISSASTASFKQERMYSEEEVEQIARFGFNAGRRFELKAVELDFTFEKWFEQFKKK
jgi:hypothetical protein